MGFLSYVRSEWPSMTIMIVTCALVSFVLEVAGARLAVVVLVACMFLVATVLVFAAGYARRRGFYNELESYAVDGEHPLWAMEGVARPDFLEGELTYDALASIAKSANDEVAKHRRQVADYREYIETWVHESKSPLAAAHLMLENLDEELTALARAEGPERERAVSNMALRVDALDEELDRVEGYINQALFYARSEALDRDYLIRKYSLRTLTSDAIKANARALISAYIAPVRRDLDFEVFTDKKWIEFIFGQIIQNSVKYACDRPDVGSIIEFSAVLVDEGTATERVELTVRDNGCGVAAADLPRVFDKGFTGENGRTSKRSTGIGLYLVKRLCQKMGVGIEAYSEEGIGFELVLSFSTNKYRYFEV